MFVFFQDARHSPASWTCAGVRRPSQKYSAWNLGICLSRLGDPTLEIRGRDVSGEGARVVLRDAKDQVVGDRGIERTVKVARFLRGEDQRETILAALLGHCGDKLKPVSAVRFVEYDRVGDSLLPPAPKHVLVDPVERKRSKRALHRFVHCLMDLQNCWTPLVQ